MPDLTASLKGFQGRGETRAPRAQGRAGSVFLSHHVTFVQSRGGSQQTELQRAARMQRQQIKQSRLQTARVFVCLCQNPLSCLHAGDVSMQQCGRSNRALQ